MAAIPFFSQPHAEGKEKMYVFVSNAGFCSAYQQLAMVSDINAGTQGGVRLGYGASGYVI